MTKTNYPTYGYGVKDFDKLTKKGKIFHALMGGAHLSPDNANAIANTTEGTRFIRMIREFHPIEHDSFPVKGGKGTYYRYYFSDEHIKTIKDQIKN